MFRRPVPALTLVRRDSDAPRSPSSSSEPGDSAFHYLPAATATATASTAPRNSTRRFNDGAAAGTSDPIRHVYGEEENEQEEVQTPGMEISFDIDSDVSPYISSSDDARPPGSSSRMASPVSPASPSISGAQRSAKHGALHYSPSPPRRPRQSHSTAMSNLNYKIHAAALASSSSPSSFAQAHAPGQGLSTLSLEVGASRSKDGLGPERDLTDDRSSVQAGGPSSPILLSSPEIIAPTDRYAHTHTRNGGHSLGVHMGSGMNRQQVPDPISINSESDMEDEDGLGPPNTASTLRTARPKRYIPNRSRPSSGSYAKTKRDKQARPPATASPTYRLGWRNRKAPPPLIRSRSCPSLNVRLILGCSDDTSDRVFVSPFDNTAIRHPTLVGVPNMMLREPSYGESMAVKPSPGLRRAISGSRSKRNTFGPCEIYDDAGEEYPGVDYGGPGHGAGLVDVSAARLELSETDSDIVPRSTPRRTAASGHIHFRRSGHQYDGHSSSSSRRDSRNCPSGPSSAQASPTHGPILLAEELMNDIIAHPCPHDVRMTPTNSLDGVVGAIRASRVSGIPTIRETEAVGGGSPKDGWQRPKDRSDITQSSGTEAVVHGYNVDAETDTDVKGSVSVGSDLKHAETPPDKDGRISNAKGLAGEVEKDVSDVCPHGNDSAVLPCDPLPPIVSSFTPSPAPDRGDLSTAAERPRWPASTSTGPQAAPAAALAAQSDTFFDDSPIHSTSVNNTRPPSASSASSSTATTVSLHPSRSRSAESATPDANPWVDRQEPKTPLAISESRPLVVKGPHALSPSEVKDTNPAENSQHSPEPTSARWIPSTPPRTGSRVSVHYPTPPPRSPLPPTPPSAASDKVRTPSTVSKHLSHQLSLGNPVRRARTTVRPRTAPNEADRLTPAFGSITQRQRPVSVNVSGSSEGEEGKGKGASNMALQVDYRNTHNIMRPGHHREPSVPHSTRSTHSSFSTSTVPLGAPSNYFNRVSVQSNGAPVDHRLSRFTVSSGSGSSSYSSEGELSKVVRRVQERPEISTVFEEEGSFEARAEGSGRYEQTLRRKRSDSTLDSAQYIPGPRRQRAGTISSQYSATSDRSAHPFAASASRSIEAKMSNHLQPKQQGLQPSRSSPNLRQSAKDGALAFHQVTLQEGSDEDDEKCPVCIESLNASFKLPGEKPHIVPECGHALHEECFTHVYGDVPSQGSTRNVGLCGVCRQPIKIVEGGGDKKGRKGKFAAMAGQGSGLRGESSTSVDSSGRGSVSSNLQANDPVIPGPSMSPKRDGADSSPRMVMPNITIRPETSKMNRQKRQLAAMVTVAIPGVGERERYPRPNRSRSEASLSPALPPSPISTSSMDGIMMQQAAIGGTLPFDAVQADLERRLQDFSKSSLAECGPLRRYDLLDVRKGDTKRPFLMYLFSDALACISEETPSALSKMFKPGGTLRASRSTRSMNAAATTKTILKLRGRIHFKHVRKVIDSSTANELSLTILMIDENHQTFIIVFKDRAQYNIWRKMLDQVVKEVRDRGMSETGGNSASKVAKLMGTGAPIALRKANPAVSPSSTINSNMSGLGLGNLNETLSPSLSTHSDFEVSPIYSTPLQPLCPVHTPVDLVIVLAIPQTASAPESAPLKVRLMRQALGFILATMGPRDRISLVSCEQAVNIRKTPLLCATRPDSRRRLEQFVDNLGAGGAQEDEFEVEFAPDERADLVTAMNVSLDVLLQRTAKNPLAGLVVVSDTAEVVRAGQLELIFARLDSVNIPIHTIGYGKAHDPSPLWLLCNQSNGTYTFVREWYHLRDTLAGVVGGLMSIAVTRARISLSCEDHDFRIARVMGVQTPIPAQGAKTIDIELRDLRFGETREILVELDYEGDGPSEPSRPNTGLSGSLSMDRLSLADSSSVVRDMVSEGRMADDVPAVEVDCSFHDPACGRTVLCLSQPILLTIPIVSAPAPQVANSRILAFDPVVKRRRMEILGSDMIARALLCMTRQNSGQAERLLLETRGVIVRLINTITNSLPQDRPATSRKELMAVQNAEMMQSVVDDLEQMAEAVLDQPQVFERDHRNLVTQQANILRTQQSWTTRSATERMYCTEEVREFLQISGEWSVRA